MENKLIELITAAQDFGLNYVFIDKGMIDEELLNKLKKSGYYSVVVGQGEVARIKISW